MNAFETEDPSAAQISVNSKNRLTRYTVLILAATYVIVSSYFIFDTRSRLASLGGGPASLHRKGRKTSGNHRGPAQSLK